MSDLGWGQSFAATFTVGSFAQKETLRVTSQPPPIVAQFAVRASKPHPFANRKGQSA